MDISFNPLPVKGTLSPRGGHTSTIIQDKIYIFGGSCYSSKKEGPALSLLTSEIQVFDVNNNTWSVCNTRGNAPSPRYGHTATSVGKKIVILGGFNGKTYLSLDEVFIFDTSSFAWFNPVTKGSKPEKRYAHTTHFIQGGKLLIWGGCGENGTTFQDGSLWMLDLATMTWTCSTQNGDIPPSRAYHCSVVIFKYMYIFGGRAGSKYFNDVYRLYLDTMTWEKLNYTGTVPSPRSSCTANQHLNKMIIFGGMDGTRCYNEIFIFDTLTLKWTTPTTTIVNNTLNPLPRHKHSSCNIGNSIYVVGGMEAPPNVYSDILLINLNTKDMPVTTSSFPIQRSPIKTINPSYTNVLSPNSFTSEPQVDDIDELPLHSRMTLDFILCRTLDKLELEELEQLESIYVTNLPKIIKAKKAKIDKLLKSDKISALEQEIYKLRNQLKELGYEQPMDIAVEDTNNNDYKSISFGSVSTRTYNVEQGQGIPSVGVAPLGIGNIVLKESTENIEAFENRRQYERKGVNRIPEQERIQILKSGHISDDSIEHEGKQLQDIIRSRILSVSSPTSNPLNAEQLEYYKHQYSNAI